MTKQKKKGKSGSMFPPAPKANVQPKAHSNTPNLYWAALDYEELRRESSRFVPLEASTAQVLYPPSTFRFVPQGSQQWKAGHAGLVTTGNLKDAIGFCEDKVARSMGVQAEHSALLRVYHHLQQPLHPAFKPPAAPELPPPAARGTEILGQEHHHHHHRHNNNDHDNQNDHNHQLLGCNPAEGVSADDISQEGAAPLLSRSRMASMLPSSQATSREEARLKVCAHVAAAGLPEVCMRWGQIQEPASLYALLHVFPQALLFEVGMFVVPESSLPTHWSFGPGSLPPLGSSPDGLIAHPVLASTDELQWLLKTCASLASYQAQGDCGGSSNRNSSCSSSGRSRSRNSSTPNSRPSSSRNAGTGNSSSNGRIDSQELSNLKAKVRTTLHHLLQQVPVRQSHLADERGDIEEEQAMNGCAKRPEDGNGWELRIPHPVCTAAQQGTSTKASTYATGRKGAVAAVCRPVSQGTQAEEDADERNKAEEDADERKLEKEDADARKLAEEDADEDTGLQAALVELAASAVGAAQLLGMCAPVVTAACLQQQQKQQQRSGEEQQPPVVRAACKDLQQQQQQQQQQLRSEEVQQAGCERTQQPRELQHAMVLEAVEVKNTVPFLQAAHKAGAQGGAKVRYVVRDRGPRDAVAFHWVPQLMLHMLATGTWSALLICRSVTKGIRVFRVFRDDEYLFRMISILSRLYTQYVLQGREPPPNAFHSEPSYASLLSNTARIARSAIEVAFVGGPAPGPDNTDGRAFV